MNKLTDKRAEFVRNKVAGMGNEAAAVAAGYATRSAAVTASKLMADPKIRQAIKAVRGGDDSVTIPDNVKLGKFGSSLAFMQAAYNAVELPLGVRLEAAKQALPYEHAKLGEVGKKQAAKDKAAELGKPGGRFAPKQPPSVVIPFKK